MVYLYILWDRYFPISSAQGCCTRYSLGQGISSAFQETPKSVDMNIPRLLIAKNSPLLKGLEARIVIIVPLGAGSPFETTFHFSPTHQCWGF